MTSEMIWELIGYLGSAIVLVSLLMSSVIKLRILNTIGSFIFCVYALVIRSYPTAVMNGCLVIIDLYFLIKLIKDKKSFSCVKAAMEDATVTHFLETSKEDIAKFFPDFNSQKHANDQVFLVYQNMTVAGILLGEEKPEGEFDISLDYTTPQYRDCSVGKFIYQKLAELKYKKLVYAGKNERHEAYVARMGFVKENNQFVKTL